MLFRSYVMQENYAEFYADPIRKYQKSRHIFDEETTVQDIVKKQIAMGDKMSEMKKENPLEMLPINKLLVKFSVPSIIAMLVTALYNIVDQFFIGQAVGSLGNAATSISFPLSITCIAIALLFGIGGASAFNLSMGAGDKKTAAYYIGNAAAMLFLCGLVLCIVSEMFLKPML